VRNPDANPSGRYDALLRLSLIGGLGPILTTRLLSEFGGPERALQATEAELQTLPGFGSKTIGRFLRQRDRLQADGRVEREYDAIERAHVRLLALDDAAYPIALRHIPDPPPLLFVRGRIEREDALAVAIVGSRRCTSYGREQADRFAAQLASHGLCVVSGGARGIDAAAHRAALRVHGRTVAVIGSGLGRPYPADHAELFDRIADSGGAVLSEHPMATPPRAEHFPRRNRIISGLSLGVLVVEAVRRSGALITARIAAEEHHREVMALPGRVDSPASAGCHQILRDGWASLVTGLADVMEALGETGRQLMEAERAESGADSTSDSEGRPAASAIGSLAGEDGGGSSLRSVAVSGVQQTLLAALNAPLTLDELCVETGLAPAALRAELTLLQIRGAVEQRQGRFVRTAREG